MLIFIQLLGSFNSLAKPDGLRFIIDYYHLVLNEKDFADSTSLIASRLKTHYANISEKMGSKNSASEAFINYIAFEALGKKQYNKAEALSKLNFEWYPKSHNAYNSFADYFLAKDDTANAITNYKKALQIDTNGITQRKINALIKRRISTPVTVDLQKYTGVYNLEIYNIPIVLEIRDNTLWAKVPG